MRRPRPGARLKGVRIQAFAAALAAALVPAAAPALAAAATPTFVWTAPQPGPEPVPAPAPFLFFARFAAGEELQRFYFTMRQGATETVALLVPAGAAPPEVTVRAPDGDELSLPAAGPAPPVWLGPIALRLVADYPYTAQGGDGIYALLIQPGSPAGGPYAVGGNWQPAGGLGPLGPFGLGALLRAPVTWLRTLLWLWG